jgi:hypothetical protein
MQRLTKSNNLTWWNGSSNYSPGSNLDHVVAAEHLNFTDLNGAPVSVRGWVELTSTRDQIDWINAYSDHCLLYFEIQKV